MGCDDVYFYFFGEFRGWVDQGLFVEAARSMVRGYSISIIPPLAYAKYTGQACPAEAATCAKSLFRRRVVSITASSSSIST